MRPSAVVLVGVLLVGVALIVGQAITPIAHGAGPAAAAAAGGHAPRPPGSGRPAGVPGIREMKTDGGVISRDDVVRYVQQVGMPRTLGGRSPFTVKSAEILTSGAISTRLHGESIGFADNQPLWFVELRGRFVFPGPRGAPVTANAGYQVFMTDTGYLIMYGGME